VHFRQNVARSKPVSTVYLQQPCIYHYQLPDCCSQPQRGVLSLKILCCKPLAADNGLLHSYSQLISRNRRFPTPYRVHVGLMETGDFKDYKTAAKTLVRNRNKEEDGNNISWLLITWFRYDPNENGAVLFKYDYDDEFRRMPVTNVGRRRKRSGLLRETVLKQL